MKIQFKHQAFQAEAAKAVCDVFSGQPKITPTYLIDKGLAEKKGRQIKFGNGTLLDEEYMDFTGYKNGKIRIDIDILSNIQKIQRSLQIEPSAKLEGTYNLSVEMETGVGKTYTYIKTMYELNKRYGFTKFIVVVPSVAIREGVYKSFQLTEEHFAEDYGKKIRYFIYNSKQLHKIDQFANDSSIHVMIINSQAFNATGNDAKRINKELDSFRSRKPIDVIAQTHPILIIDEPQSVEGPATKKGLEKFKPLITLRYSATLKKDETYNLIYRLDALEAYNKRLVKKIAVKGISVTDSTGTEGYLYLEGLNFSASSAPTATLEFECRGKNGIRKVTRKVTEGYNLFEHSGEMNQYQGYTISDINGITNTVSFTNGITISSGDVVGLTDENQIRRIQIRETIKSHIERERALFSKGIKVLSLFFIDEVAKYRQYNDSGEPDNGEYATVFEEEYRSVVDELNLSFGEDKYLKRLNNITAEATHQGYFSIDKKGRYVNGTAKGKEKISDDVDAYDLIMKNKEQLLSLKEPVRFIFSHSALKEGWDNPNVFQICTLKTSGSEIRKRQEVGRGLRLCVNNRGERMDTNVLGGDVHSLNPLTVIANESYDKFASALQSEMADAVADRPHVVDARLFTGMTVKDATGNEQVIDPPLAGKIHSSLIKQEYIDINGSLTDTYYEDVKSGNYSLPDEIKEYSESVREILDNVYNPDAFKPEDARSKNVDLHLINDKLEMKEFKALWERINSKTAYTVNFDSEELIKKSIAHLDEKLKVSKIFYLVESGAQKDTVPNKDSVASGDSFEKNKSESIRAEALPNSGVKYDLVGTIAESTKLTRRDVAEILKGIQKDTFDQFSNNPEGFIIKASKLIDEQKATAIVEHIEYHQLENKNDNLLENKYDTGIFTEPSLKKGTLGKNAIKANKSLYNYVITDSETEKKFAEAIDIDINVAIYVKLPGGFYIDTPVGKYNPDWAIAFKEGTVKHIYFVAETKGDLSSMQLRDIESLKIHCAREHFKKISSGSVKYEVITDYAGLLSEVCE